MVYILLSGSVFELIHKEVTKLSLAYTAEHKPRCENASKLFEGVKQCVLALFKALCSIHSSSQGKATNIQPNCNCSFITLIGMV